MSKFDRNKKGDTTYIYPHKHCQKCQQMIDETFNYCSECYKSIKEKKEKKENKKRFSRKNKDSTEEENKEN